MEIIILNAAMIEQATRETNKAMADLQVPAQNYEIVQLALGLFAGSLVRQNIELCNKSVGQKWNSGPDGEKNDE